MVYIGCQGRGGTEGDREWQREDFERPLVSAFQAAFVCSLYMYHVLVRLLLYMGKIIGFFRGS